MGCASPKWWRCDGNNSNSPRAVCTYNGSSRASRRSIRRSIRHVRYVYACQESHCEANLQTAEKPPQPIEKGLAGPGLLAFIIASKWSDHLPLNRLEDILTRHGLHIARSTQCDWMAACAARTEPLYRVIVQRTLQSKVLGTDDTTVSIQDSELDRTRTGRFWSHFGDERHPYVCYELEDTDLFGVAWGK